MPTPNENPEEDKITAPEVQIVPKELVAVPPKFAAHGGGVNSSAPMSGVVSDLVSASISVVIPAIGVP